MLVFHNEYVVPSSSEFPVNQMLYQKTDGSDHQRNTTDEWYIRNNPLLNQIYRVRSQENPIRTWYRGRVR